MKSFAFAKDLSLWRAVAGVAVSGRLLLGCVTAAFALASCAAAQQPPQAAPTPAQASVAKPTPALTLAILAPKPSTEITAAAVNVLCKTEGASSARINGVECKILPTGLFVRDQIPVEMGRNVIEAEVVGPGGESLKETIEVVRIPEPTPTPIAPSYPLFIDEKTIVPNEEVRLETGEPLHVEFWGAPGNIAEFRVPWSEEWIHLEEDHDPMTLRPLGHYGLNRAFTLTTDTSPAFIQLRLRVPEQVRGQLPEGSSTELVKELQTAVQIYGKERYRLLRVAEGGGHLVSGLHTVRLGGPYFADLPQGTQLLVTGRRGGYYRVRLTDSQEAWIPIEEAENVHPIFAPPHLSFTSLSVQGDDRYDTVTIPYSVPVPFRITPIVDPAGGPAAIEIDFYYAHDAATWISHRPTAKVVKRASTEQIGKDHLRVRLELRTAQIWGYRYEVRGESLILVVRRPPPLAGRLSSPLKGLTVAVEAGHGGSNSGAMGVAGTPEKVINRMTSDELMAALREKGANTVDCRVGDEAIGLGDRIQRAEDANADLFISIHANAAGNSRGYLAISGTSTYYKWAPSYEFSEAIHARLLEKTGLGDFGNVGNFNYAPIRTTWMPAMLVEQAFMSNPEDEAKMLDPEFRARMVEAIVEGTEDFLKSTK